MNRIKFLFAAVVVATIVGLTPAAHAQVSCLASVNTPNCFVHVVGAGSSAQYNGSAIAGDLIAGYKLAGGSPPAVFATSTQCVFHWSAKSAGNLVDNRGTVAIPLEPANMWIVWIADLDAGTTCPSSGGSSLSTGNNHITDIWMDASVDSTVGVRAFLAQNTVANGGSGVAVETIPTAAGNVLGTGSHNLWPDNASDSSVLTGGATNIPKAVGTDQGGINDVHVNVGFTDIRPEDALFATTRAIGALTTTRSGLGYNSSTNVGQSILTSEGTGTKATPVKFALTGNDPITRVAVRTYTTVPIGAAPLIFIYNNNNDASSAISDAETGILGTGLADGTGWPRISTSTPTAGKYLLANVFDGSTSCDTHNAAFGGNNDGAGTPLHLFLREPLSGTENATEYTLFRTAGNISDSQEQNVVPSLGDNPLSAKACGCGSGSPNNPTCTGAGDRSRGIGTGEIVGSSTHGILGTPYGLGYLFFGFANASKFGANTQFNYLTLDHVDPLGFTSSFQPAGELPNCAGPCTAATWWPASGSAPTGYSYPTLRNGTYKAWSIYRWIVDPTNTDAYGPASLAQITENNINSSQNIADFVPFRACPDSDDTCSSNTTVPTDGLDVYRSHFTQSAVTCSYTGSLAQQTCDGNQTNDNAQDGGNSLGGGPEAGGDEGGLIMGWDYTLVNTLNITTGACAGKTKISKATVNNSTGRSFGASATYAGHTAGNPLALLPLTVTINGVGETVSSCINPTATILYVNASLGTHSAYTFSVYIPPVATGTLGGDNGTLGKKQ